MEHRFGDAAEGAGYIPVSSSGGYLHPSANAGSSGVPVGAPVLDQTFLVNSYPEPTARFVDAGPLHPSAKRKISRLDDKYVEEPPSHRTASASGRARLHPRNRNGEVRPGEAARSSRHSTRHPPPASSPKRVDFSERLRLREVKWDGTYRDSVAHNDNSTLGLSAAPSTIYAASSAAVPPSSPNSQSTLTDPRAIRETEIRFLNEHITESLQRHDRAEAAQRRGRSPRLTHVDVELPRTSTTSGRGGSALSSSAHGRAGEFFSSRGVPTSDGVGGGSSASGGGSVSRALFSHGVPVPAPRSRTPTPPSMSSERGGDSGEEERGAVGGAESREERTRKQKIKKSLKELPQDDIILAKLREKIRHQRLSASSTDTSQNDSLSASVPLSDYSRDSTPQHMLHDEQEPIKLAAGDGCSDASAVPEKMPRSRKVAAGPPTPTYKGFSEVRLDPHLQATVNKVNRLHAPRRKSGSQKSHDPVQAAIQPHMQGRNSPDAFAAPAPSSLTPEKPKKAARLVAHGQKPSKPGAKNLITTSSWRAGQELILRELGPAPKSKVKGQSAGPSADDVRQGREEQRRPDGAEGNMTNSTRIPATGADNSSRPASSGGDHAAQLAQSRALSEDAKRMLSDLQLENEDREKHSSPARRPGVKRKAPKAEKESEKQQPLEKQRHYDTESVRQFMARQKAERQRRREETKKAEQLEMQKRQQLMQELISKQRSAASTAKPSKKVKRVGRGKQRVLFPASSSSEQAQAFDQRIRALLGSDSDKENVNQQMDNGDDDDSDADTLTGDSEEGSTPRATPVNVGEDAGRLAVPSTTSATESDLNERLLPSSAFGHPSSSQPASLPTSLAHPVGGGSSIEFQGKKLNLDIDSVLNKFSQVVNQRRSQGGGAEREFRSLPARLEGHAARSREERLQALKTSSKTLQSKLASAEISLKPEVQARLSASGGSNPDTEFVPRYERIAGSQDGYGVFTITSNLPGAQNFGSRVTDTDSASDGPPPQLATTGVRTHLRESSVPSRPTPASPLADTGDDDSTLTESEETSTFSMITAEDELDGETPRHRKTEAVKSSGARQAEGAAGSNAKYTTPNSYTWENPRSDPYSILNVFSRQLRSGNAAMNSRDGSSSTHPNSAPRQDDSTRLKDPVLMSTHQVLYGQTRDGQPIVAKTSYTRFEATIPDRSRGDKVSQASQPSGSVRNRTSRSEERSVQRSLNSFAPARALSASEDSKSLDSDEDAATPKAVSSRQTSKKSVVSYRRQVSDTGQETDVSQLSEDEPRVSARYDGPTNVQNEVEEEAKWSPAALERQMAAELARLESLEDSLRQLSSADRTRAVALAQQETVSVAQVLKARQQAHTAELRSLQLQVQEERLASAQLLQQQLYSTTGVQTRGTETPSLTSRDANRAVSSKQLLVQAENRRPESRSTSLSRSKNRDDSEYSESTGASRGKSVSIKTVSRYGQSGSTSSTTRSRTGTAEPVETAEDSQADSDSSIKTASDLDLRPADDSIAQEVRDEGYSMSFEDSMTEEESFKQVLPSESHRKDAKRRKSSEHKPQPSEEGSSLALGDLTSLFVGEDSFSRFTADMVRQIMREEELRAQHQAALLRLREKALKEKTKAELAWLQQQRQQVRDKGADDVHPQLQRKEQKLLKQLQEQQAEIRHLQEANRLASKERQSLLKQHEQIARMQQETRDKMKNLQGRLGRPDEGHTEDEISMVDGDISDVSEDTSLAKDVKSDSEVSSPQRKQRGEKQNMAKQQKLRLDQKYLTAREQRLLERKKHASDLLKWKQDLDAEEEKVLQMERHALQAWEGRVPPGAARGAATDKKKELSKEETEKKVKASGSVWPDVFARSEIVTAARDDSNSRTRTALSQASEAVSTHISASEATADRKKSQTERTESSVSRSRTPRTRSPPPSGSDGSIPEDISDTVRDRTPPQDRRLDSSDDTIVNSSVDEEMETPARKGKKSPVETQSDVSDYEVRIRQLSDMLRRRRKEADMLKKERSRRQKDKLKAQEETLKKQLEAYENYIAQVKAERADLEHEAGKPGVRPQIKQPRVVSPNKSLASPSTSPGPPSQRSRDEGSNSDGTDSNQTSPSLSEGQDAKVSPLADKSKKKPSSLMDRISEGSESASFKRGCNAAAATGSSGSEPSVSEALEEAMDEISTSNRSKSAMLNIKTSLPSPADVENHSLADENQSYSFDFTDNVSRSLGQSHSRIPVSLHEGSRAKDASVASTRAGKSEAEVSEYIESAVSTAKSDSASAPKFDLKAAPGSMKDASASISTRPTTGIQESDSENESRINSHRSLSRPSSERSTGSTTYSDLHDFDEVEEDISSESDRTPVKGSVSQKEPSHSQKELSLSQKEVSLSQKERSVVASVRTDDDISEHISASLPSISEKRSVSGVQVFGHQDSIDAALGDLLGPPDEEEATPTVTPRPESPFLGQDEISGLLMTDPLADFHEGDPVLVWGHLKGVLLFKGTVAFAPGFWAGVELVKAEGDTDGERDGKRYFTCHRDHGVLVPGSEISPMEENGVVEEAVKNVVAEAIKSLDESLTDQDEISSATEKSEPSRSRSEKEGVRTPVKEKSPQRQKRNLDLLADDITADLAQSLVAESVEKMNAIATKNSTSCSPAKVPPPTLPKPKVTPQQQQQVWEKPPHEKPSPEKPEKPSPEKPNKEKRVDNTTSAVVTNLLDDAISEMIKIRRGRHDGSKEALHNGYSDDSGVDRSHDSSLDPALGVSPDPELGFSTEVKEMEELRRPMSPEPFQRPRSPVPGSTALSAEERQELDEDLSGLLGDDQEFEDDDYGLSKPPPPYPGSGDQASGAERPAAMQKLTDDTALYVIPRQRAEVEGIVADAVSIYWDLRRCGEAWESATPPSTFLHESSTTQGGAGDDSESGDLVTGSRRIYKQLLFDLTGEIVREIYQYENDEEPAPWQKPEQKRQRYFKGVAPPMTMDVLLPLVQTMVVDILGLNGSTGKFRGRMANKWNVRKKKDHVDAVLVEELREEEADWINYDHDELAVKMQLTDNLFDSLLSDTVDALNRVYSRRQLRPQP